MTVIESSCHKFKSVQSIRSATMPDQFNLADKKVTLSMEFKFTENETKIAIYSLVAQSGYDREGRYSYGSDVLTTCHILDIPLQEMLDTNTVPVTRERRASRWRMIQLFSLPCASFRKRILPL